MGTICVSAFRVGIWGRGRLIRRPSDPEFTFFIVVEMKPYSVEKDVRATKLITKAVTVTSVSMKRVLLRLRLRLAMEKKAVMVMGNRRGRINAMRKEARIASPADMRRDGVLTIWQPL